MHWPLVQRNWLARHAAHIIIVVIIIIISDKTFDTQELTQLQQLATTRHATYAYVASSIASCGNYKYITADVRRLTAVVFISLVVTIQNAVTMLARWNALSIAALKLPSSTIYITNCSPVDQQHQTVSPSNSLVICDDKNVRDVHDAKWL